MASEARHSEAMALLNQIDRQLIQAMKQNNTVTRDTLRLLKTAIKNRSIQKGHELADEEIFEVLVKEVKQRHDSIKAFESAGRTELAEQEKAELAVIMPYLPEPIDKAELVRLIDQTLAQTGAKVMSDMGKVMSQLIPQIQGRADTNLASQLVRERLSS